MIAKSTGIEAPFELNCAPPLLVIRFEAPQKILGWSLTKPGFAATREIVWFEVRDGDLPLHIDPVAFLKQKLSASGFDDAAAFMTSRDIRRHHVAQSRVGAVIATCVATVGLSNGERVGARRRPGPATIGTINMLVHVSRPLSADAFVEAISIATQARTAAILETSELREGPPVTGTGTDCIIVAAPHGDAQEHCAGLHTDLGQAIGAAAYNAIYEGAVTWSADAVMRRPNAG